MCAKARQSVGLGIPVLLILGCCDHMAVVGSGLPEEIEMVRASKNDFAQGPDQSLAAVSAGTVMDDLANLDGCWAAYDIFDFGPIAPSGVEDFEFYRFDLQAETLTWQVLQNGPVVVVDDQELLDAFAGYSGSLDIVAPNAIVLSATRRSYIDLFSGNLQAVSLCQADVLNYRVTVAGDEMKIDLVMADEDTVDQRDDLVFTRLECP